MRKIGFCFVLAALAMLLLFCPVYGTGASESKQENIELPTRIETTFKRSGVIKKWHYSEEIGTSMEGVYFTFYIIEIPSLNIKSTGLKVRIENQTGSCATFLDFEEIQSIIKLLKSKPVEKPSEGYTHFQYVSKGGDEFGWVIDQQVIKIVIFITEGSNTCFASFREPPSNFEQFIESWESAYKKLQELESGSN